MRQRVMIAMALACSPKLLIADEPTTGLDPLIAQQIMELIARLRRERDMAVLFVTHDLSVVQEHADSIHVLYAGRSVEWGGANAFFAHPRHPYSEALLGSVARLGQARLQNIPGNLPEPESRPAGCRFAPRCAYAREACNASYPQPENHGATLAACLYPLPLTEKLPYAEVLAPKPAGQFPAAAGGAGPHRALPWRQRLVRRGEEAAALPGGGDAVARPGRMPGRGGRERLRQIHLRPRRAADDRL